MFVYSCGEAIGCFFPQLNGSEMFQKLTEEKYHVEHRIDEAAIVIRSTNDLPLTLKVTLTSPLIRDEAEKKDGGTTWS